MRISRVPAIFFHGISRCLFLKDNGKLLKSSNNHAELYALKMLFENLPKYQLVDIYSDSEYVLRYLFSYPFPTKEQKSFPRHLDHTLCDYDSQHDRFVYSRSLPQGV